MRRALLPAAALLHRVQALRQAIRKNRLPAQPAVAITLHVQAADRESVHTQLPRDSIDLLFGGKRHLRYAKTAKRAKAHLVGIGHAAMGMHMGNVVRTTVHQQGVAQYAGAVVAIRTAVQQQFGFACHQRAVAARTGLHANGGRMACAHGFEVFFAAENQLDGLTRLHRQQHDHRLHVGFHFVAKASAYAWCEATQFGHGQAQRLAHIGLHAKHRLVGRPQRDAPGRIDLGQCAAGL